MGGTPTRGRDPKPDTIEVICAHCGAQVQAVRTTANQPCPKCGGLIRV